MKDKDRANRMMADLVNGWWDKLHLKRKYEIYSDYCETSLKNTGGE